MFFWRKRGERAKRPKPGDLYVCSTAGGDRELQFLGLDSGGHSVVAVLPTKDGRITEPFCVRFRIDLFIKSGKFRRVGNAESVVPMPTRYRSFGLDEYLGVAKWILVSPDTTEHSSLPELGEAEKRIPLAESYPLDLFLDLLESEWDPTQGLPVFAVPDAEYRFHRRDPAGSVRLFVRPEDRHVGTELVRELRKCRIGEVCLLVLDSGEFQVKTLVPPPITEELLSHAEAKVRAVAARLGGCEYLGQETGEGGARDEEPSGVAHFLYFETRKAAEKAGARLERRGGIAVEIERDDAGWLLLARAEDGGPTHEELSKLAEAAARRFGGDYDGWGSPV